MLVLLRVMLVRDHELLVGGGQLLPGPAVGAGGWPCLLSIEHWVGCPIHPCVIHCNTLLQIVDKSLLKKDLYFLLTCVLFIEGVISDEGWRCRHLQIEAVHGGDQVQGHGGGYPLLQQQSRDCGEVEEEDVHDEVSQEQRGTHHSQAYPWQQEVLLFKTDKI